MWWSAGSARSARRAGPEREHRACAASSGGSWSTPGSCEFVNGGDTEVWIGSADMMHRNLDRRVETLVSLQVPDQIAYVGEILDRAFEPGTSAWDLGPDGQWVHNVAPDGGQLEDFQAYMIRRKHLRGG